MVAEGFAGAVHAVADGVGPLSDGAAREFAERFPLDAIFRELSGPQVPHDLFEAASIALGKVFDTAYGASLLPGILPYAAAALQSRSAALRRLAVQLLGRLLPSPGSVAPAGTAGQQQPLELLVQALQDEDVGVASTAESELKTAAGPQRAQQDAMLAALMSPSSPAGQALRQLSCCDDPILRMRSLTLLVGLAAQSPGAAAAVRQSGLLEPLLSELRDPEDLLSCMAALQLVRDAAEQCDPGMALALQHAVLPRLGPLLQHPEPVLQSGALRAGAALLAASLEAGEEPMAVDGSVQAATAGNGVPGSGSSEAGLAPSPAQPLLAALKSVLDVGGSQEFPAELEEAALDAVGILGMHSGGAEALLTAGASVAGDVAYKALGRAPSPAQRVAALHALASLAGAERLGRSGKLLPPAAEDALRVAVFEGAAAAGAGATPADALQQQLRQPFLEQRVAAYRCLSALAARDWVAGLACAHPALLAALLDPLSESGKQGCEWRHACVSALAATIADVMGGGVGAGGPYQAVLVAAAERVQAAVRAGPYGSGRTAPTDHLVATEPGA